MCGLAAGAFALGATLGDGRRRRAERRQQAARPSQLAGQRIVVGFDGPEVPPALERMIREGTLAGVVLFAGNFPSRAAGRRLIDRLQAIPPAARPARPAAGDGRSGGRPGEADRRRPERLGARRWANAAPPSAARRDAAPPPTCATSGINVDLAPVLDVARPGGTIAETDRGFGSTAGRSPRPPFPSPRGSRREASPLPPSTSRARRGAGQHRLRGSADRALRSGAAACRRGALPRLRRGGGRDGDAEHRDLPRFLAEARPPSRPDRRPASCAPGSASKASRSPTRSTPSPCATSAAPQRRRVAAARAGVDLLLFTDPRAGRARAGASLLRRLRSGPLARRLRGVGRRVLRLRHELARPGSSARRTSLADRHRVEDAHRVAPGILRRVHRRIGRRDDRLVAGPAVSAAEHRHADAGGDRRRRRPSRRGARGSLSRSRRRRSGLRRVAARQDHRELVAAEPARTSVSRVRPRSTSAISPIMRSPTGWPRVSLTCLKLSRSSISTAPLTSLAAAAGHRSVRRSSSKRRRFFSPVSESSPGLPPQLPHPLVTAPDQDQRAQQRRQREADDGDQKGRLMPGPVGVADDQQPGAVGDPDRRPRRLVERDVGSPATGSPARAAAASVSSGSAAVAAAARTGSWKPPVANPTRASRRCAARRDRSTVGVDRLEDVDADTAERQPHRVGRRRPAAVASAEQHGARRGRRRCHSRTASWRRVRSRRREGERVIGGPVAGHPKVTQRGALDDRNAAPALEFRPFFPRDRLHERGRREGAGPEQGVGEGVELVLG